MDFLPTSVGGSNCEISKCLDPEPLKPLKHVIELAKICRQVVEVEVELLAFHDCSLENV